MKAFFLGPLVTAAMLVSSPIVLAVPSMQPTSETSPATKAYMRAMEKMHGPMMKGISDPDPDVAFVKGMIPHHEGAISMAEIELKYGKDPVLRKLARQIIDSQKKEVAFMKEWLWSHHK